MTEKESGRLLTLGEAARRLQLEPEQLHALIGDGGLRYSRDEQGRVWFEPATVDRLALARGTAGKGIDDGRPQRRSGSMPASSTPPDE
jgi:hypothetical protein